MGSPIAVPKFAPAQLGPKKRAQGSHLGDLPISRRPGGSNIWPWAVPIIDKIFDKQDAVLGRPWAHSALRAT